MDRGKTEAHFLIGQPRALKALMLGVEINAKNYHIMVTGPSGTGRMTAIKRILKDLPPLQPPLQDLVYVNNFEEPDRPILLILPAGKATLFDKAVNQILERVILLINQISHNKEVEQFQNNSKKKFQDEFVRAMTDFEVKAEQVGFRTVEIKNENDEHRTEFFPIHNNKPMSWEEYRSLFQSGAIKKEKYEEMQKRYVNLLEDFQQLLSEYQDLQLESQNIVEEFTRSQVEKSIKNLIRTKSRTFSDPEVQAFLEQLGEDILENLDLFQKRDQEGLDQILSRYGVNIIIDHSKTKFAPVVFETRCDAANLLGTIDIKVEHGTEVKSHYMQIRPGAFVRANGGFLVLRLEDLLANSENWLTLMRTLDTGLVEITVPQSPVIPYPISLKPKSIPIQVKVIIVGPEDSYRVLAQQDPNFVRLFKINAAFDSEMDSSVDTVAEYLRFIQSQIEQKKLLPIDLGGLARVVEYGHRITGDRHKISTQFSLIADILTESNYWASKEKKSSIDAASVQRALQERTYINSIAEEKIDEEWQRGRLLISLEGKEIGQVNGLAVLNHGHYQFGRPIRITARATPGRGGIVNIEGKAGLSGRIHTKAVHILEGLLKSMFAPNEPFSAHLSLAVEQNYGGIEGDSASAAEACALISALSLVPLRQDIAISGSINQLGQIQSVGGVTEKVEGFFSLCQKKGLAGQGVIVPLSDIDHLLLKEEVLCAIESKQFHLWGVSHLSEALHLLTGLELGQQSDLGEYSEGNLGFFVQQRLKNFRKNINKA